MKENQTLVPWNPANKFAALCEFYRIKALNRDHGTFSCLAGETFPEGWHAAFKSGVWEEKGIYGDNFRAFFGLSS